MREKIIYKRLCMYIRVSNSFDLIKSFKHASYHTNSGEGKRMKRSVFSMHTSQIVFVVLITLLRSRGVVSVTVAAASCSGFRREGLAAYSVRS